LQAEGVGIDIVDAVSNDDLLRLGPALRDLPLVTAGSGVALGLPANFGLTPSPWSATLPPARGWQAPGADEAAEAVAQAIARHAADGRQLRAVMLARLGPNVWHDTPAAAMAVLEETARLWLLARPTPLDAAQRGSPGDEAAQNPLLRPSRARTHPWTSSAPSAPSSALPTRARSPRPHGHSTTTRPS
jgi:hypothetical protein